jgi:hypothetical protein
VNRGGSARSVETVILAALVDIPRVILFPKAVMTSRNFWLRSALALSLGFYSDTHSYPCVCRSCGSRVYIHTPAYSLPYSSCRTAGIIRQITKSNRYRGGVTCGPCIYSSHPDTIKGDFEFTLSACFF